jgi:hypothetical protein
VEGRVADGSSRQQEETARRWEGTVEGEGQSEDDSGEEEEYGKAVS